MADRIDKLGKSHWKNLTHHLKTILELQRQRLHTPCLYGQTHQMMKMLQIEAKHIWKEWTAQVRNIREAAAAKAAKADKDDDGKVNKGDSKQAKPKLKQATHISKKKEKDSSSKKI